MTEINKLKMYKVFLTKLKKIEVTTVNSREIIHSLCGKQPLPDLYPQNDSFDPKLNQIYFVK